MFKNLQHVVELCLRLDENCRKLFREEWEKNMKRIFFLVPFSLEEVLKHTAKTKHWCITDPTRKHWFHGVSFLLSMGNRVCFLGDKILICWFLEAALFTIGGSSSLVTSYLLFPWLSVTQVRATSFLSFSTRWQEMFNNKLVIIKSR